jgi:hypothetical protein
MPSEKSRPTTVPRGVRCAATAVHTPSPQPMSSTRASSGHSSRSTTFGCGVGGVTA